MLFVIQQIGMLALIAHTLVKKLRHESGKQKEQLKLVIFGVGISFGSIIIFNLILVQAFKITSLVYVSNIGSLFFTGCFTYAIIRQRMFDLRLAVARSVTYILLLFTLGAIYSLLAFQIGGLFFHGENAAVSQQYFNVAVAIILAFTFQGMRRFFERITDKIFYRDKYDPQVLINDIGHVLATEIDLHKLSTQVLTKLSTDMRVAKIDLLVLNHGQLYFEAHTSREGRQRPSSDELEILGSATLVADELSPSSQKDVLDTYGFSVSLPLVSTDGFIGYVLLGEKRSGDIYNPTDIRVLGILANEMAVAIQNAKSYTEIAHFNETLKAKIAAATAQLQEANSHLKQMDEVKDEFISMASHQLGTPLTVIDGYISMVTQGIYGTLGEKQVTPLSEALNRVRIMKRLVADLLNVSRMEAGRFFIDAEPTDLNKVVPEEVEMLQGRSKEKEVTLEFIKPTSPLPLVTLDEQKTRQAMMNLIDNAIFYTPKGHVKVYLESDGHNAIFRVVDNGIGVPEAQKEKLFGKFFRADNARTERPNGTGIGLFLVKRVVEDQGGKIIFESEQGKGSTFGFSIPLSGTKSTSEAQMKNPPAVASTQTPAPDADAQQLAVKPQETKKEEPEVVHAAA